MASIDLPGGVDRSQIFGLLHKNALGKDQFLSDFIPGQVVACLHIVTAHTNDLPTKTRLPNQTVKNNNC